MGRISATESITLDGVMQGPAGPDEDTREGFALGGWAAGYSDDVAMQFMSDGMSRSGAMLFGRRTYEQVLGFWTSQTASNPFTTHLIEAQKFVVSRGGGEAGRGGGDAAAALPYPHSTLLVGEAVETVASLRADFDGTLSIIGSGELVRSLYAAGLIDEFVLQIHPVVLGSGTRLFDGDRMNERLTLQRSVQTTTGVIIAQYLCG